MGKATDEGWRKPDDPMLRQTTIVIGGLRGRNRKPSKPKKSDTEAVKPSQESKRLRDELLTLTIGHVDWFNRSSANPSSRGNRKKDS